ncbi:MAG: hypothetical protein ACU84J_05450 [Gammaproteobacteria bacterium]
MGIKISRRTVIFSFLMLVNVVAEADQIQLATVNFGDAETQEPAQVSAPLKKSVMLQKNGKANGKKKNGWHELYGSLDRHYVYLIVKKTGHRDIEGYLYDGRGDKKYIYGEWFNNQLQIYDQSNKRMTVLLYD